jgi:hypothetical protein
MKNSDMPAMPQNGAFSCADDFNDSADMGGAGLTKREHFAAMALNTVLSSYNPYESGDFDSSEWEAVARNAVGLADALLSELEKPND